MVKSYGYLFFDFFVIFPADCFVGLSFRVSGAVSAKRRAAMGGHCFGNFRTANLDLDLHLSKYGRGKHLVYRTFGRDDSDLFRRRSRSRTAKKTN